MNLDLTNKKYITLEEELEKLKLYLEIEKLRFGDKLNYDFIIEDSLETDMIYIPSMVLQPFVENAIWHGILPSDMPGKVSIAAETFEDESMLRITIADNGIGLNMSRQLNQKNTHKSMGTQLTIDRIELFCKKIGRKGQVRFQDCSELNISDQGTIICIEIPVTFSEILDGKY